MRDLAVAVSHRGCLPILLHTLRSVLVLHFTSDVCLIASITLMGSFCHPQHHSTVSHGMQMTAWLRTTCSAHHPAQQIVSHAGKTHVTIYSIARQLSPNLLLLQVMLQAGAYVKEEVCRALIVLISNAPELHGYAARCMYQALKSSLDQADIPFSLVTCTSWFLGKHFGRHLTSPGGFESLFAGLPHELC